MFPSFTGNTRRPRQVNLSGRNSNPFAAASATRQSPSSAQLNQNTVAHAQAERILRHQERLRPPAAIAIQRSWRGYRSRRDVKWHWRREWDAKEQAELNAQSLGNVEDQDSRPYANTEECLDQMKLLLHFASPRERSDVDRLKHFAWRYARTSSQFSGYPADTWVFPLVRLWKLTLLMLRKRKPRLNRVDRRVLLELLCALTTTVPERLIGYSTQLYEALRIVTEDFKGSETISGDWKLLESSVVALLCSNVARTGDAYEAFTNQFLRLPDIPLHMLQAISKDLRIEDLTTALSKLLSTSQTYNLFQSSSRAELLWLVAYYLYFHRSSDSNQRRSPDAKYVDVLSKLISHLAADIARLFDSPTSVTSPTEAPAPSPSASTLSPFVRAEISNLISQDHVSGLLGQAADPAGFMNASSNANDQTSALAVYVLTLLRAFPRRGDDIRMWLYLGSTSIDGLGKSSSIPAIRYYFKVASHTSVYTLIKEDPNNAIGLLNPGTKRRKVGRSLGSSDRDEQWQVVLLFLELYPIALKVMDDEEFLSGGTSTETGGSWTRQSALSLDQIKDLTVFLKNLAFAMYWNASEIAGAEEPENINSIAEYFGGNLAAFSDHHPDAKSTKAQDATIAGLQGMTISYMKGAVTGLLRMIYERDSRRDFLPDDHWLMTQWFEMDQFIPAVVQEEEERHKIQESYEPEANGDNDDDVDDEFDDEEAHDDLVGTQRVRQVRRLERLRRQQRKASRRRYLESVTPRLEILQNMPFFIPFATRVQIFRQFVHLDMIRRRGSSDGDAWRFAMMNSRHSMGRHR
ncbi:MAG: hypothetical protein Q9174_001269, partial [Haloplaca sp. 1 TL-2023]